MVERRTEEAIDAILGRIRQTCACISNQPVVRIGVHLSTHRYEIRFAPRGESVRVRSEDYRRRALFDFMSAFAIDQRSGGRHISQNVRLVSYEYRLLDPDQREILAFHWHPTGLSNVTDPHLHLSSRLNPIEVGRNQEPLDLADMHVPTGFVTLEDVVRRLITEFGIAPRRDDWGDLLRANRMVALGHLAI